MDCKWNNLEIVSFLGSGFFSDVYRIRLDGNDYTIKRFKTSIDDITDEDYLRDLRRKKKKKERTDEEITQIIAKQAEEKSQHEVKMLLKVRGKDTTGTGVYDTVPHVAQIVDFIDANGSPAIIFEYFEGVGLGDYKFKNFEELLTFLINLVGTIDLLNSMGIAHGDLGYPNRNNILYNERTGDYSIIDFGQAEEKQGVMERHIIEDTVSSPASRLLNKHPKFRSLEKLVTNTGPRKGNVYDPDLREKLINLLNS